MAILTEGRYAAEGLMSEANSTRSRDYITVASGAGKLPVGMVLAKLTTGGKYVPAKMTGTDGSQTAVAVLLYPVDATSADVVVAAITRDAEWNVNTLSYFGSVDDATKKATKHAELAAVGIMVR